MRRLTMVIVFVCFLATIMVAQERYYLSLSTKGDTAVVLQTMPNILGHKIEVRAKLLQAKDCDGVSPYNYGVKWLAESGDSIKITVAPGNNRYDMPIDDRFVQVSVCCGDKVIAVEQFKKDVAFERGVNSVRVEALKNSALKVSIGHYFLKNEMEVDVAGKIMVGEPEFFCHGAVEARIQNEPLIDVASAISTKWTVELLKDYYKNKASAHEGFWTYLDRQNEMNYARPGGKYTMALVKNATGGYDIVYLAGAQVNNGQWSEGMLKGRLIPTIFADHFNLEWYDSMLNLIDDETSATIEQGAILTLNFPLLKAQMRFSKMPKDMK